MLFRSPRLFHATVEGISPFCPPRYGGSLRNVTGEAHVVVIRWIECRLPSQSIADDLERLGPYIHGLYAEVVEWYCLGQACACDQIDDDLSVLWMNGDLGPHGIVYCEPGGEATAVGLHVSAAAAGRVPPESIVIARHRLARWLGLEA